MKSENANSRGRQPHGIILLVTLVLTSGLAGTAAYVLNLESRLMRSMAASDAAIFSSALREFRTLYTSEVVERIRPSGIEVTHDYHQNQGAIPLPATLSMLLGNRIPGGGVRLYSDFPFPWRITDGGPQDRFEREALEALREEPNNAYWRFEEHEGQERLRYATADLMRESCVGCHNEHPASPFREWETGDVRGVLSVTRPLDPATSMVRQTLRGVIWLLAVLTALALTSLGLLAFNFRKTSERFRLVARDALEAKQALEREVQIREANKEKQRRLEDKVWHAQKLESLGVMAGGIAHDFNNLLMGVVGNAELAKAAIAEGSDARRHLDLVLTASDRACELTRQLLAYAGHGSFVRRPVDVTSVVEGIRPLLETAIGSSVDLRASLAPGLPKVDGDPAQIEQVVMNLITNASDAMSETGGVIDLETSVQSVTRSGLDATLLGSTLEPGEYICLEVRDQGIGLAPDTMARMFDPFFTTKVSGRGLGLASVQGIVRSHGGTLSVASVPDEGTTFQILLPPVQGPTSPQDVTTGNTSTPMRGKRVLVVDDDRLVRDGVTELLRTAGIAVVEAATGEQALASLENDAGDIGLVLLDMRMPGLGGAPTLDIILENYPHMMVIISSGYETETVIREFSSHPQVSFLQKPYSRKTLLQELTSVLGEAAD